MKGFFSMRNFKKHSYVEEYDCYKLESFDESSYTQEKEYFINYILDEKENLEAIIKEQIYFVFVVKARNGYAPRKSTKEYLAGVDMPLSINSLKANLDEEVGLDNPKICILKDIYTPYESSYDDSGCYCTTIEKHLCYIKHSDLINFLNQDKKSLNLLLEKLNDFKFVENNFYQIDSKYYLEKKKTVNELKYELKYNVNISNWNKDNIELIDDDVFRFEYDKSAIDKTYYADLDEIPF